MGAAPLRTGYESRPIRRAMMVTVVHMPIESRPTTLGQMGFMRDSSAKATLLRTVKVKMAATAMISIFHQKWGLWYLLHRERHHLGDARDEQHDQAADEPRAVRRARRG